MQNFYAFLIILIEGKAFTVLIMVCYVGRGRGRGGDTYYGHRDYDDRDGYDRGRGRGYGHRDWDDLYVQSLPSKVCNQSKLHVFVLFYFFPKKHSLHLCKNNCILYANS